MWARHRSNRTAFSWMKGTPEACTRGAGRHCHRQWYWPLFVSATRESAAATGVERSWWVVTARSSTRVWPASEVAMRSARCHVSGATCTSCSRQRKPHAAAPAKRHRAHGVIADLVRLRRCLRGQNQCWQRVQSKCGPWSRTCADRIALAGTRAMQGVGRARDGRVHQAGTDLHLQCTMHVSSRMMVRKLGDRWHQVRSVTSETPTQMVVDGGWRSRRALERAAPCQRKVQGCRAHTAAAM